MRTSPTAAGAQPPRPNSPPPARLAVAGDTFFGIFSGLRKRPAACGQPLIGNPGSPRPLHDPTESPARPTPAPDDALRTSPDRDKWNGSELESEPVDLLDPIARQPAFQPALQTVGDPMPTAGEPERVTRARAATFQDLFGSLVRRAAWSLGSDRRSATLRLEIGAGALEGGSLVISADPHEVQIMLDAPSGVDGEAWKDRLRRRLASEGLVANFS